MANLGDFIEKIENFLNDLARLEITTVVGDFKLTFDKESQKWVANPPAEGLEGLQTNINLFQGDLWSAMHNDFVTTSDPGIRNFHQTQVEKAQGIVDGNIKAFKEIVVLLADARKEHSASDETAAVQRKLAQAEAELAGAEEASKAAPGNQGLKDAVASKQKRVSELRKRVALLKSATGDPQNAG